MPDGRAQGRRRLFLLAVVQTPPFTIDDISEDVDGSDRLGSIRLRTRLVVCEAVEHRTGWPGGLFSQPSLVCVARCHAVLAAEEERAAFERTVPGWSLVRVPPAALWAEPDPPLDEPPGLPEGVFEGAIVAAEVEPRATPGGGRPGRPAPADLHAPRWAMTVADPAVLARRVLSRLVAERRAPSSCDAIEWATYRGWPNDGGSDPDPSAVVDPAPPPSYSSGLARLKRHARLDPLRVVWQAIRRAPGLQANGALLPLAEASSGGADDGSPEGLATVAALCGGDGCTAARALHAVLQRLPPPGATVGMSCAGCWERRRWAERRHRQGAAVAGAEVPTLPALPPGTFRLPFEGRHLLEEGGSHGPPVPRQLHLSPDGSLIALVLVAPDEAQRGTPGSVGLLRVVSPPLREGTWFPGRTWQILICAACDRQLGWLFRRAGSSPGEGDFPADGSFGADEGMCVGLKRDSIVVGNQRTRAIPVRV